MEPVALTEVLAPTLALEFPLTPPLTVCEPFAFTVFRPVLLLMFPPADPCAPRAPAAAEVELAAALLALADAASLRVETSFPVRAAPLLAAAEVCEAASLESDSTWLFALPAALRALAVPSAVLLAR